MRHPRIFKVVNSKKYKFISIIPVVNTSCWHIYLNNKISHGGIQFTSEEIEEYLILFNKHLIMIERKPNR